MKKYLNKALLYQYYYTGRWSLLIGLMMFSVITYFCCEDRISYMNTQIRNLKNNTMDEGNFLIYFFSWFILGMVYFSITGINKRSSLEFLQSGPFTKEDIKKSQFIVLIMSLLMMTIVYIYVYLCISYKNSELVSLIYEYKRTFFCDIVRFFVTGFAFISYILLMDVLFANIIFEIIMIIFSPFIVVFSIALTYCMYDNFIIYNYSNLERNFNIMSFFDALFNYITGNFSSYLGVRRITIVIILIFAAMLFYGLSWYLNKIYKMNKANKFFNFNVIGQVSVFLTCYLIIMCFGSLIVKNNFNLNPYSLGKQIALFMSLLIGIIAVCTLLTKTFYKYLKKYL